MARELRARAQRAAVRRPHGDAGDRRRAPGACAAGPSAASTPSPCRAPARAARASAPGAASEDRREIAAVAAADHRDRRRIDAALAQQRVVGGDMSCRLSSRVTVFSCSCVRAWPRRSKVRQMQPSAATSRARATYCCWLPPQPCTNSTPGISVPGVTSVPAMCWSPTAISSRSSRVVHRARLAYLVSGPPRASTPRK